MTQNYAFAKIHVAFFDNQSNPDDSNVKCNYQNHFEAFPLCILLRYVSLIVDTLIQ